MPLLQRRQSPPPIEDDMILETVLLETSYDEELGSKQTEVSKLPFSLSQFPVDGMISAPPLLDELNSDSDSSFDSTNSSLEILHSKIHSFNDNVEVCAVHQDDGDFLYTEMMMMQPPPCSFKKRVRFSTAETRHYPLILGNHPNCNDTGLPLALDWKYTHTTRRDLQHSKQKEPKKAQRLTLLQRMKRLKGFYTTEQLWLAERHRRLELEREEEEMQLLNSKTTNSSLCGEWNDEDDDLYDDVDLLSHEERQVMKQTVTVVCDVMQCLVSE